MQTPTELDTTQIPLLLPSAIHLQVSCEQFQALAVTNRELRLERTSSGELIVNPPAGWESGERNFNLTGQLARWYEEHSELGKAFDSSTGFTLPNGAIRSPDVAWISAERWDALSLEQKKTFPEICPDFVIELRSGSDSLSTLQAKMQEYIKNGAKLDWLIDPQNCRVEIYRQEGAVEYLDAPIQVEGEGVLSGFVLTLDRIWS